MRPSELVVLPSFWRVAAMKTRGVTLFTWSLWIASSNHRPDKFCRLGILAGKHRPGFWSAMMIVAWQFLASARIQCGVIDGLQPDNSGDPQNVMGIRTARNICGRSVKAKEDLSVGICPGNVPNQLAGNITGIEIGENQDVRISSDFAVGKLAGGDFRNQG